MIGIADSIGNTVEVLLFLSIFTLLINPILTTFLLLNSKKIKPLRTKKKIMISIITFLISATALHLITIQLLFYKAMYAYVVVFVFFLTLSIVHLLRKRKLI